MSIGTMKRNAKQQAEAKGHIMDSFRALPGNGTTFVAKCRKCHATVVVDFWNKITIGEAIEQECQDD